MLFIALLVFACLTGVMAQPGAGNPQQFFCAKPPNGCASQIKEQSCINWHGCSWSCEKPGTCGTVNRNGQTFFGCTGKNPQCCTGLTNDQCQTKPYRVPTASPTPPTLAPTKSPIFVCRFPNTGCASVLVAGSCNAYNGCKWNTAQNVCQAGGCQGTPIPTASPTTCTDLPPSGCGSANSKTACSSFQCCVWSGSLCLGINQPPPPACKSLKTAACRARADCRVSGKKCIVRGSRG